MQMPEFRAEQAGFLVPPQYGGIGRLEMSGGEFCGNAVRACGLLLARRMDLPYGTVPIEISGCSDPVAVTVNLDSGFVTAEMPLPEAISMVSLPAPFGICPLIRFSGIWHVIAENIPATEENFILARDAVYTRWTPEAFGRTAAAAALPLWLPGTPPTEEAEPSRCGSRAVCWRCRSTRRTASCVV